MPNWTEEQKKAITARDNNLLVAAAAGSGKTAVLVERIIGLIIQDKVDLDRLLIVTFTHAAAGEMRERISAAILAELEKKNENEGHLRRQINMLSRASISTLHSFCTDVVRKYFHCIEVDPNFRVGDATETGLMKLEVIEELFESEYEKASDYFLGLVEMFGGNRDDTSLKDLVLHCHEFIQSKPYPRQWLEERVADFAMDTASFEQSPWAQAILQQVMIQLSGAKESLEAALEITQRPGGPEGYREAILHDLLDVEELTAASEQGIRAFYARLSKMQPKNIGRVSKDVDEALKKAAKDLRDEGRKIINELRSNLLAKSPDEYVQDLNELHPYMEYLSKLVFAFAEGYREKKAEKGILDFNDLEHYALEILANQAVAQEYRQKYAYIFVDEYQDSNLVQETILNFIKRENNLFLVGDVKQSIYRFRLADPSLFLEKYESFASQEGALNRRIDLRKNFRSRAEIIDGVNYLFKQIMSKNFGEIDYDENACLYLGAECREMEDPAVELYLVEKNAAPAEPDEELEDMGDIEAEARIVARRIKGLLGQQIFDPKLQAYRKINYQDIVVLLRTTQNWAQGYLEAFMAEGIPAYADVNTGYFQTLEVNIFLNLLRIIDNKRQDIPLLSVMRSPIGGFQIEDLIRIRASSQAPTYFGAIEEYLEKGDADLQEKLRLFLDRLSAWKEASRFMQLDEFIWKLLMETGYYYYVGAMPGGEQRQANLRVLFDRAGQFQKTSIKGLFNFIKFIDKLNLSSGDMGEAKILGENDNVVRIMSIHKSKGLEFPVVIVGGLGKNFNLSDTSASVLFHKDLGIGPKYVNAASRVYTDTIAKVAMKSRIRFESLSEEMRVLYVACTRPKDKLILVGSVRDLSSAAQRWTKAIGPFNLAKGKNYLDWIGPVVMRHPGCGNLRELCGVVWDRDKLLESDSKWKVVIVDRSRKNWEEAGKARLKRELRELLEEYQPKEMPQDRRVVIERLNWEYGYMDAVKIPSKLSVTQLKKYKTQDLDGLGISIPPLVTAPRFMEGEHSLTGAAKGTVLHFIMQHLDLQKVNSLEEIRGQIGQMIEKELLTKEAADAADAERIFAFFRSGLGQRVLRADKVYRETPFNLVRKACQVIDGIEKCQDGMLIQGVIDLYFREGDELVLVDYKTDYVTAKNRQAIINKYRVQVELYKDALESIQGKRVKECYLYLLDTDEEVRL